MPSSSGRCSLTERGPRQRLCKSGRNGAKKHALNETRIAYLRKQHAHCCHFLTIVIFSKLVPNLKRTPLACLDYGTT